MTVKLSCTPRTEDEDCTEKLVQEVDFLNILIEEEIIPLNDIHSQGVNDRVPVCVK